MSNSIQNNRPDLALLTWQTQCLTIANSPKIAIEALISIIEDSPRLFEFKAFLFVKLVSFMSMEDLDRALKALHRSIITDGGQEFL